MASDTRDKLPRSLQAKSRTLRLGDDVPTLLAHPDFATPVPAVLWMHGRTVTKELDPGRYQRWLRAGIAAVAVDLPGHGERFNEAAQSPHGTLNTLRQMASEIDGILADLPQHAPIDMSRLAIGGMSAGGMAALVRLTRPEPHPFIAAAVESTTGNLSTLYFPSDDSPEAARPWPAQHDPEEVAALDPMQHLEHLRPMPLLAIHTEADETVPWPGQRAFLDAVRTHFTQADGDPELVDVQTYAETGAPSEHAGFGREAAHAKNRQTEFLARVLRAEPVD